MIISLGLKQPKAQTELLWSDLLINRDTCSLCHTILHFPKTCTCFLLVLNNPPVKNKAPDCRFIQLEIVPAYGVNLTFGGKRNMILTLWKPVAVFTRMQLFCLSLLMKSTPLIIGKILEKLNKMTLFCIIGSGQMFSKSKDYAISFWS